MAPEYALWGCLTYKADVYSFGVVALEIVAGKNNMKYRPDKDFACLVDWVRNISIQIFSVHALKTQFCMWSLLLGHPSMSCLPLSLLISGTSFTTKREFNGAGGSKVGVGFQQGRGD